MTGLAQDGRTDRLSGSFAQRPRKRSSGEDVDSGPLYGAGEDQEGQGNPKEFPAPSVIVLISDNSAAHTSPEDEEEEEDAPPSVGGDKKRKATPIGEAEGSKKGRTLLPDSSAAADEGEDEWLPRAKPLGRS